MAREQADSLSTVIIKHGFKESGLDAGSPTFLVRVRRQLPNFLQSVELKYVRLGYHYLIAHGVYVSSVGTLVLALSVGLGNVVRGGATLDVETLSFFLVFVGLVLFVILELWPRSTYLVDYACFRPPDEFKVTKHEFIELARKSGNFTEANLLFMQSTLEKSGIGDESYLPTHVISSPSESITVTDARKEAAMAMFGAVDMLLSSTKVSPKDISIVIVNCGIFSVTPSLSAMLVNHYKLRTDIHNYNLGGMGCAAGANAVDLAQNLLASRPGTYALVVSTEVVTATWYGGRDSTLLLPNCFLRMGAAALLLTNRRLARWRAKYVLSELVRTHKAADDRSFQCVVQTEDDEKRKGLAIARDIVEVGGQALKDHMTTLGPLVLPVCEQLHFFSSAISLGKGGGRRKKKKKKPYIPDFKLAFEHVCIMACSKLVLEEIQKNLDLTEDYMEPSKMTLHRFGNTSSSSVWYELAYLEARGKINKGDRVWQISFGSGFKCNSVVWKALQRNTSRPRDDQNPWKQCIEGYSTKLGG